MKSLITTLALSLAVFVAGAQQQQYSRVRIYTGEKGLKTLEQAGIPVDHGLRKAGVFIETDLSQSEIAKARDMGYRAEIIIDDVRNYYLQENQRLSNTTKPSTYSIATGGCGPASVPSYTIPSGFNYGSMGGFYTYQEFLDALDTMAAQYPNLITPRQQIDTFTSWEGRPIYWVRISDNPNVNEPEPEVLFTSVHHAREPGSLSQLMFYMYYLLENYGTDSVVTAIVDNCEIYCIPMVNPDGYVYNEVNNPNGGGMWRKNRRNNGNGDWGVDINRNYGYKWGLDNTGSSPDPQSDTYRGPYAFSEPEIQAVKWFDEQHNIRIVLNYHTYGDLFIYPWGYDYGIYTPDSAIFVEYAKVMTRESRYTYGTGDQTVGYITNGDSDDWGYGEQTSKNKIFSCTPEVGTGGFWPPQANIIPDCIYNLQQNLTMPQLAMKYAIATDLSDNLIDTLSGYFPFEIKRLGLDSPASFTVSITPAGPELTSVGNPVVFNGMSLLESRKDSFAYTLSTSIQDGQQFAFILSVNNGLYTLSDTVWKTYGSGSVAFSDDAATLNNWSTSSWGTTTSDYYSAPSSITDSPLGNYNDWSTTSIKLSNPVDLTNATGAYLTFYAKWAIEAGWDYVEVMGSPDNSTWTPLCGLYTKDGNSNQDQGQPLYDGFQSTWVQEFIDLSNYAGQQVYIRFKLKSDNWTNYDGYYFDDLNVISVGDTITGMGMSPRTLLMQNTPNPANTYTYITFASLHGDAILQITNSMGQVVRQMPVTREKGSVRVDVSGLSTGVYQYRLITNEESSAVRKMMIVR